MNAPSVSPRIIPVVLSGGSGSRLWPMSRELYPKQLLNLCSERSMLQETAGRVADGVRFEAPLVVCNHEHRFVIGEQLRRIGIAPRGIVLEPMGRNTAAACAVAALIAAGDDPETLLLFLPADHLIQDIPAFLAAVDTAAAAAAAGNLVTFGITPTAPETGYGYIRKGEPMAGLSGTFHVAAFVEKPTRDVAEGYLADGRHFWNSGMFLFPAALVLEELERHVPAVVEACRQALADGGTDLDFFRLDAAAFSRAPSVSIDVGIMERTDRAAVVPCSIGWTDIGAWSALWEIGAKDGSGNVVLGDVVVEDAANCYVRSEDCLTAVVGIDDVVVVVTDDAVLVAGRDRVQDVKQIVDRLKRDGRDEVKWHRKVHRPWGTYQALHDGERFQVKMLAINPGSRMSLQRHHHRAEHWVVVNGTALVTRGDEQIFVYENQSIYIPMGTVHRLENPGKVPLNIVEVQSGSYLGEDDIIRLDDTYGRG